MFELLRMVLIYPWSLLRPQHELAMEVLALRHQITVLKRQTSRPKLRWWDRCLWVMLKRVWPNWRTPLMIFRPETVYMANWHSSGDWQFKQSVAMALPTVILKAGWLQCWAARFLSGRVAR